MTLLTTLLLIMSAGPTPVTAGVKRDCIGLETGIRPANVRWGTPASRGSCFFFSGPGDIGRDDRLGAAAEWVERGNRITLRFGVGVRFQGRRRGSSVRLTRVTEHSFGGKWRVTEVISGTLTVSRSGGDRGCRVLKADYTYAECHLGDASRCPGPCWIRAPLTVTGR